MSRASRLPRLHVVTDDAVVADPGFADDAAAILEQGGRDVALHLRAPRASGRWLYQTAAALAPLAARSGALLLVSDRVDVARAAGAGGMQLPRRGIPPAAARRILGAEAVIGASVHSAAEARAAIGPAGADFLLAGTIFESRSHPGRSGAGMPLLAELLPLGLPVVAIGGITPERVGEVMTAGASGVAVLGAVWRSGQAARAVHRFLETLGEMER